MYNNRIKYNSFFEEKLLQNDIHETVVPHIYGNSLGTWPNSVRTNGTHMKGGPYPQMIKVVEDSLFFGKAKYNTYIYPIKVPPHFDKFTGVRVSDFPRLNGEYFWKHMSEEALIDARSGRAIIFLDYAQENFVDKIDYDRLHEALEFSYIPKENIILAFNSFNAKEIYESWYPPEYRRLEVWNWPFVTSNTSYHYKQQIQSNGPGCVSLHSFKQSMLKIRKNHLLFKIRRTREHRLAFLYKLASDGLLEKVDWSCLNEHGFDEQQVKQIEQKYGLETNTEIVKELYNDIPHYLQSESDKNYYNVTSWNPWESECYKDAYVYLCTETFTDKPYKSLTEKTFKPIANFMPFLVFGSYKTLELLKELGFKTFSPWIDESYDEEPDIKKRAQMIYSEISRLCSMTIEDLHKWYWEMEDILIHNHEQIQKIYSEEKESTKLIEYLNKRVNG
jgi:hypothetical protein